LVFAAHKLFITFLLAAFLVAQGSLLFHHAELEAHAPGEECEFCLHASKVKHPLANYDGGLFASSLTQPAPFTSRSTPFVQRYNTTALARGPPSHLLV